MTLLLLAGTGEARVIAGRLAEAAVSAVASLAGAVRKPRALDLPMRVGGFGGDAGFEAYLGEAGIGAVLDATHPFATRISARTARICAEEGVPYCQYLRPAWEMEEGWVPLKSEAELAGHVAPGECVFLATGRQTAGRFGGLAGAGRRVICRVVEEPEEAFPFAGGEFLVARPPFRLEDEVALFERLGVDWLVAKNAGGAEGRAKLEAAERLGIRVAMIERAAPMEGVRIVDSVEAAVDWAIDQAEARA